MDSKATGPGCTSPVKVFTVFVLSGSLFLLIYNVGRKRINAQSSQSGREPAPPVISNPSILRGYFSHHKDKPSARQRKPSLTAAFDASSSNTNAEENAKSNDDTDQAAPSAAAFASDDWRGFLKNSSSASPRCSYTGSDDAETGPYMVSRRYSSTSRPSRSILEEPSSSATGHEGQMLEHMRYTSRFTEPRKSMDSNPQRRRSSSSLLGDMSQLETSARSVVDSQTIPDRPIATVKADIQNEDRSGQNSSPSERDSTMPREHFLKPLVYMMIWSTLRYFCHVYSSTLWGAKMAKFPAPFLKAAVLFVVQAIISSCILRWPRNNVFVMPWNTYTLIVAPIATAAALDYDLQDASVYRVTVGMPMLNKPTGILEHAYMLMSSFKDATLETVWDARMQSKGYVPICVLFFALAFRLERGSIAVAVSVAVIAVGFILGVSNGTNLVAVSLRERSFGPLLSGFRWAAIQTLLQKKELGLVTPVVTMRALSPSMALVAVLLSAFTEPWSSVFTSEEYFQNSEEALMSCAHIFIGALLGTALALAELVVIYHTSALTFITLGLLKDFYVVIPRLVDNTQFSELNVFGLVLFSVGFFSLIWFKYKKPMKTVGREGLSQDPPSSAFGSLLHRWPRFWGLRDFTISVSPIQHFREYFGRAQDIGTRISRKLRALWEVAP